jgi:hypothetical protein
MPLYLSLAGFNMVSISNYKYFCFMQHLRRMARDEELGSFSDWLAETCWFYSQNVANVLRLLPRAGLSLTVLLAYSLPQPNNVALGMAEAIRHDPTFFHRSDATLTSYARGVLIANAAWTAWRGLLVLLNL